MSKFNRCNAYILLMVAALLLNSAATAPAADKARTGAEMLLESYHRNSAGLEANGFGLPLVVESREQDEKVHVDVYGIVQYPFGNLVNALRHPSHWCDIVFLHPNIKACTFGERQLTLYPGRKEYQEPEDTHPVIYSYRVAARQQGYLDILLSAESGPFGTRDHRMRFEALPLDNTWTYLHVSYTYSDSVALRLASKIYFATIARSKVGFTVTGTDRNGNPVYIGGPRGALERSAVRYYCAIQAFMNTLRYPEASRFDIRASEWHDLTSRFSRQLLDLPKTEYLSIKSREHKNQLKLQQQVAGTPD